MKRVQILSDAYLFLTIPIFSDLSTVHQLDEQETCTTPRGRGNECKGKGGFQRKKNGG
jgi:hypothetical protein